MSSSSPALKSSSSRPEAANSHSFVLHRALNGVTSVAARGEGVHIIMEDGRKFLDAGMAPSSCAIGHCHPKVVEAVRRQIGELHFVHGARFSSRPMETLAERLIATAPPSFARVYFSLSGSDAVEAALKLARQYFVETGEPQRTRFIGRKSDYHGATVGALSMGSNANRQRVSAGMLLDVPLLSPSHPYRYQRADETPEQYGRRVADELETEIKRLGPETVIAFIAETVNGSTLGAAPPAPGYFRRIREICDKYGVLLILDEVLCGMGYTGTMYACEQEGVVPDLLTIGKGLGAGHLPVSGVLVNERIVQALMAGSGGFAHGQTYEGYATGCAAALAVQEVVAENNLIAAVAKKGDRLNRLLHQRFDGHPYVGDIRGRGLLRAVEFVEDVKTKQPFPATLRLWHRIREGAAQRGLLCFGGGGDIDGAGDHIIMSPSFIVTDDVLDTMVGILGDAVDDTFKNLPAKSKTA